MSKDVVEGVLDRLVALGAVLPHWQKLTTDSVADSECSACGKPAVKLSAFGVENAWCSACLQQLRLAIRFAGIGQTNPKPAAPTDGAGRITGFERWIRAEGIIQLAMLAHKEGIKSPPAGTFSTIFSVALMVKCFGLSVARNHDYLADWTRIALMSLKEVTVHRIRPDAVDIIKRRVLSAPPVSLPTLTRRSFIVESHNQRTDARERIFGNTIMVAGVRLDDDQVLVIGVDPPLEVRSIRWHPSRGFSYRDGEQDAGMVDWRAQAARFVVGLGIELDEARSFRLLEQDITMEPDKSRSQPTWVGTIVNVAAAGPKSADLQALGAEGAPLEYATAFGSSPATVDDFNPELFTDRFTEMVQLMKKHGPDSQIPPDELTRMNELKVWIDAQMRLMPEIRQRAAADPQFLGRLPPEKVALFLRTLHEAMATDAVRFPGLTGLLAQMNDPTRKPRS